MLRPRTWPVDHNHFLKASSVEDETASEWRGGGLPLLSWRSKEGFMEIHTLEVEPPFEKIGLRAISTTSLFLGSKKHRKFFIRSQLEYNLKFTSNVNTVWWYQVTIANPDMKIYRRDHVCDACVHAQAHAYAWVSLWGHTRRRASRVQRRPDRSNAKQNPSNYCAVPTAKSNMIKTNVFALFNQIW